jgi:hypothetical protein
MIRVWAQVREKDSENERTEGKTERLRCQFQNEKDFI